MASLADVSRAIMRTASRAPDLTVADEKALLRRVQDGGDLAALDAITASQLRRVIAMANRFKSYGLPLDDLVQEGCIGIVLAAHRFDLGNDVPFGAYARFWMKGEMREFILRNWSIVRAASGSADEKLFFKLRALRSRLEAEPNATSVDVTAQIAAAFGVSTTEVEIMQDRLARGDTSTNAPAYADDEDGAEVGDFLAADLPQIEDVLDDDRCAADLTAAMQALDEQERFIVEQRWLEDEIAPLHLLAEWLTSTLNIKFSVATIRNIEIGAIEKLRRTMTERRSRSTPAYA